MLYLNIPVYSLELTVDSFSIEQVLYFHVVVCPLTVFLCISVRTWLAIALGHLWLHNDQARWSGVRDMAHDKLLTLLEDDVPEVSRGERGGTQERVAVLFCLCFGKIGQNFNVLVPLYRCIMQRYRFVEIVDVTLV